MRTCGAAAQRRHYAAANLKKHRPAHLDMRECVWHENPKNTLCISCAHVFAPPPPCVHLSRRACSILNKILHVYNYFSYADVWVAMVFFARIFSYKLHVCVCVGARKFNVKLCMQACSFIFFYYKWSHKFIFFNRKIWATAVARRRRITTYEN